MFLDNDLTVVQHYKIEAITSKFVRAARKSGKETAWQDAERKGMDAIREYCMKEGLPMFGNHMLKAVLALNEG
jgi:hypothetical protein